MDEALHHLVPLLKQYFSSDTTLHTLNVQYTICNILTVDQMWSMIVSALVYEADIQCPYKWIKVRSNRPVWFTSYMMEVARDRDRLFSKYRNSRKQNTRLYQQAVAKRHEFNKLVKNSKDSF